MCRLSRSNIVQITACGCINIICPYPIRYSFYTTLLDHSTIATTIKICTSTSAHLHSLIRSITVVCHCYTYHDIPTQCPLKPWFYWLPIVLPWQINKTFIIVMFFLDLPGNALFCKEFRGFFVMLWNVWMWQIRASFSKLLLPLSSKVSSKRKMFTTKDFVLHLEQVN